MSFTVTSWKETYIVPKENSILPAWLNQLLHEDGYEILFRHRKTDDGTLEYITAYVKLIPPLKEKYETETTRTGNIIGVDTYDSIEDSLADQKETARNRIIDIIEEHNTKDNQA